MENNSNILDVLMDMYSDGHSLSNCFSEKELWVLANHSDEDVRAWIAKCLVYEKLEPMAVKLLCQLAQDDCDAVRLEAVDSMSEYSSDEVYFRLCDAIKDQNELIRSYAAYGIAVVGRFDFCEHAKKTLFEAEKTETTEQGCIGIFEGLYILGEKAYLGKIEELMQSEDYQIQCSVLNVLREIMNNENRRDIEDFVFKLNCECYAYAVVESIRQFRFDINSAIPKSPFYWT